MDRRFSYSKIDATLLRNRNEESMRLTPKAMKWICKSTVRHNQRRIVQPSPELLNSNASSYNVADVAEANKKMAEILRRKKKRKQGNEIVI